MKIHSKSQNFQAMIGDISKEFTKRMSLKAGVDISKMMHVTGIHESKIIRHLTGVDINSICDLRTRVDPDFTEPNDYERVSEDFTVLFNPDDSTILMYMQMRGKNDTRLALLDNAESIMRSECSGNNEMLYATKQAYLHVKTLKKAMEVYGLIPEECQEAEKYAVRWIASYFKLLFPVQQPLA